MNKWTMIMEQEITECNRCPEFCIDAWHCVALKRDMLVEPQTVAIPDDCPKLARNIKKEDKP